MNYRKIALFLVLTIGSSWLLLSAFLFFGGTWNTPPAIGMLTLYMFMPMISAVVVQKLVYREPMKVPLAISLRLNRWFLVAWLLPPLIAVATLGVSLVFPGVTFSGTMEGMFERFSSILTPEQVALMKQQTESMPVHPFWLGLLQGLVAGPTINAVAGFGEELGWRGLLQKELGALGFWKSSLLIGFIWGVWHAPAVLQGHNYPQHPVLGVFFMTIWCVLLGPVFSYVCLKARSVIASAVLHGSLNATVGLAILLVKGGTDLTVGVTGLAGFVVFIVLDLGLVWFERAHPVHILG